MLLLLKRGELDLSQLNIDENGWTLDQKPDVPPEGAPGSPENPLEPTSIRRLSDEELELKRKAAE